MGRILRSVALCVGPVGGIPCGRVMPQHAGRGRRPIRCEVCKQGKKRLNPNALLDEGVNLKPIAQVEVSLVDEEVIQVQRVKKYCTWLNHNKHFCDKPIEDTGEIFCSDHGMPPVSLYKPTTRFVGPGVSYGTKEPGALERAHLNALKAIEMEDSPQGILLLTLARRLDDPTISDGAVATCSAQLRSAAKDVYAGAPITSGAIDEIRKRREAKIAALAGESVSDG